MKLTSLNLPSPPRQVKAANDAGWIPENWTSMLPRTGYDYALAVGDGLGSSVLMSPVKWVQRTLPEAPLQIVLEADEDSTPIEGHPLIELLDRPNEFHSGADLWAATVYSWIIDGNAYWRKVRGAGQKVKELWYVPHWQMEPKWPRDGNVFIQYYEYSPGGSARKQPLLPEDVVHFRNGINPRNTRKGMSLIYSELREIFGDDEAANMVSSLMRNQGIPGLIFSPDTDEVVDFDIDVQKAYLKQQFSGDKRGDPLVNKFRTKVEQFGFDVKQLDVGVVRDIAEERICAAIGIPPQVVGFGSGLQTTKVGATMSESIKLAWSGCIIPTQKTYARTLERSLLPDFEADPTQYCVEFDISEVEAMRENRKLVAETLEVGVRSGCAMVSEFREAMGWDYEKTDEVYLRSMAQIEVAKGMTLEEAKPEPMEQVGGNNGKLPPSSGKRLKTEREQRTIASAPDGTPNRQQSRLMRQFVQDALSLESEMEEQLLKFFAGMGVALADLYLSLAERQKASLADEMMVDHIMADIEDGGLKQKIEDIGRAHYLRVSKSTYGAIREVIGLAVDLPDFRARDVMALGGRRMGLIDISGSTRKRLFRELTEGRSLGEGPVELARRIRDFVPAGTWSSPKVRARVIARTETLHAQRASALEAYKDAPQVTAVMVFDGRLATSDDECIAMDGKIVELTEAYALMDDEHPNGTRNFAPVIGD